MFGKINNLPAAYTRLQASEHKDKHENDWKRLKTDQTPEFVMQEITT